MRHKSRLVKEIKEQLLASEAYIGILAERVGTTGQTIKKQLISESPTLCLPHYLEVIQEILGIQNPENTNLIDIYPVNADKHLHQ